METYEAVVIVLVIVLIAYVAYKAVKSKKQDAANGKDGMTASPSELEQLIADQRIQQGHNLAARVGIRNDAAGYGAHRAQHPADEDIRTRNGSYLSPSRVAEAESQLWAPYSATATSAYDVKKGAYPGTDLVQQLGNYGEGDWAQDLSNLAIDQRTRAHHNAWANEVGYHSGGAMTVDNLDEATLMATHRQGFAAFQATPVPQSACTTFVTEIDGQMHAEHLKKRLF